MVKIDFSVRNIKKCLCPGCPVQKESECAEGKRRIMLEIAYSSESGMYFERDRVPGMYCTTGEALCSDLDFNKICKCPECPVWEEYGLENKYYCKYGKPDY
ncbi:MAG: DUF2769 domain-containing protein [Methanobacterium sp.]